MNAPSLFPTGRGGADIEGPFRYHLYREWAPDLGRVCFVMLNPSTADAEQDDPTIRRCLGFARTWGFGRLDVVNLYAFRATDPADLSRAEDPVGPRNDAAIKRAAGGAKVVAAWGATVLKVGLDGTAVARTALRITEVLNLVEPLEPVHALGFTASGQPRHPLYVPARTQTVPWKARWRTA